MILRIGFEPTFNECKYSFVLISRIYMEQSNLHEYTNVTELALTCWTCLQLIKFILE